MERIPRQPEPLMGPAVSFSLLGMREIGELQRGVEPVPTSPSSCPRCLIPFLLPYSFRKYVRCAVCRFDLTCGMHSFRRLAW